MIDIIIPCYNSHETLDRCIGSILSQRVAPSIHVTLVNDAGKDYKEIIDRYSPILDIREIGYEENGGPAKARNYGLQHTDKQYVMFMDSDDALANPFSVIILCNEMASDPKNVMVISKFIEEVAPLKVKTHENDTSFMHGKMYKRSFLEKYNILQNENTRCNEDVGFNILALLLTSMEEKVKYTDFISYYWLFNPSSLVRSDKINYDHSTSFRGFAQNLTYVYEELEKRGRDKAYNILVEKVTTMERLCLLYKERTEGFPQFKQGNLQVLKDYYNKIYKHIENEVTDELFNKVYDNLKSASKDDMSKKALRKFIKELK